MAIFDFDRRTTHVGFADEAYWNDGEFRSVACISARADDYVEIESRLCMARCGSGARVSEIKWKDLDGYDHQFDAESVLKTIVELAENQLLRIDVIIWSHLDRYHLARERRTEENVDIWNLRNMYRSLLRFILARWRAIEDDNSHYWTFALHQPEGLDRDLLEEHTRRYSVPKPGKTHVDIRKGKSALNYSIQMADLLAGLGAYSHRNWEDYLSWLRLNKPRRFVSSATQSRYRFPVMSAFINQCETNNLGVFLLRRKPGWRGRGFWTTSPNDARNPINFWPYTLRNQ